MDLSRQEINRNRLISGGTTLLIFFLLLLFLILYKIITPNPPFPETGGGGGQELALGMMDMGTNDIDYGSMGQVMDVVAKEAPAKENIVTAEGGEQVDVKENKPDPKEVKTEIKDNKMVITPVPEKTAAEKLREKFLKNTGKNGGGTGSSGQAGDEGSPNGDPSKNGTGGTGTGTGGGNGPGVGPGTGPGTGGGKWGIDLKGRAVVKPPKMPTDNNEEGKVVVEITVDTEGNVIEANPNGRGTNTSSALLKAKAKQAAMATKFNVDGKFEEQKGTITIIFSFN